MGIATALSPQIDLATDPRWNRVSGTFGDDPKLATDMARAYIDGFQTSTGDKQITNGWGYKSVNAMVKHWPGGGTGEGGRDSLVEYFKYVGEFIFTGLVGLISYLYLKNRKKLARKALTGEMCFYMICILLCFVNWQATLAVFIFTFLV